MSINIDQYKSIKDSAEGLYKDKGSRFLSFAHAVDNPDEIKAIISSYKRTYSDARHVCYGWELGVTKQNYRSNDDGEPSGTAGKPILGQIHSFGLTNILVVVVRYFGGTKLGVSGLINAYKEAAYNVLNQCVIVEKTIDDYFQIHFEYPVMDKVMKMVKDYELVVVNQNFDVSCSLTFRIRQRDSDSMMNKFKHLGGVEIESLIAPWQPPPQ